MTSQTHKVDVLAVIDDEIASLAQMAAWSGSDASEAIRRMRAARDAVAELIDSVNDVLDASKVIYVNFEDSGFYSVRKEPLDAMQDALVRTGGSA